MRYDKGFTLVELLVVMTILGIVSSAAMSLFYTGSARARNAVRDSDIRSMVSSARFVKVTLGRYPVNAVDFYSLAPDFISNVPSDPLSSEDINTLGLPLPSYSTQEYTYSYYNPPQDYSDARILTSTHFEEDRGSGFEKNKNFGRYMVGTMTGPESREQWSMGVDYSAGQTNAGTIVLNPRVND